MLRGIDGAIIGYHVPAKHINGEYHMKILTSMIENLPPLSNSQQKKNGESKRTVKSSWIYSCWTGYTKEQQPIESSRYKKDGKKAKEFVNASTLLWNEAGEIMKSVFPKVYKMYTNWHLPNGINSLAGPWMGVSINEGSIIDPIMIRDHKDVKDIFFGISCIFAMGNYEGGDLVLWELERIIELRPGDLFFSLRI